MSTPLLPPPSSCGAPVVVDGAKTAVVELDVAAEEVLGLVVVVVAAVAFVVSEGVVDVGTGVVTLVGGGGTIVEVVGGASGLVVDGVVCGAVPPGIVASIGAGFPEPAAPIQRTISPVL